MKRFLVGAAIIVLALGGAAYCAKGKAQQQPVSLDYYQGRVAACDYAAAQLTAERDRLKAQLEAATAELAKSKEKP